MKKRIIEWILILSGILVFQSCASNRNLRSSGDLCGFVMNENNLPVQDFVISCRKIHGMEYSALTNHQGFFLIQNLKAGEYHLGGKKNCYEVLDQRISFYANDKVYCFQINSIDGNLDETEKLLICEKYEKAEEKINQVYLEKNSQAQKVIDTYKEFISHHKKEQKNYEEL